MRRQKKPIVRNDALVTDDANAIQVGSPSWRAWLDQHHGFFFEGSAGHFTARRELRRGTAYWYAYRRRGGKLAKTYLGRAEELTRERLEQASAHLAGQTALTRWTSKPDSVDLTMALKEGQATATASTESAWWDGSFLSLSKVKPPALPRNLVMRPRLTRRINSSLTLLIAPSGSGKSTLLNEWRQTCGMAVAWVSLDKDDDHPLRFWSTVATALQTANPDLGQDLTPIHSASPSALSGIVIQLTNAIVRIADASDANPQIGLILDDYHHIQHPEIHASIQTLLEHLPSGLQLVVASHTKPPFALGHLRAKRMVTEIGMDDLRFSLDEGINFLWQNTPGQPLAYSDMHALVKHTEGWAAGLALATLALSQQSNPRTFMATFSGAHPYLREYFTESVLYRQSPEAQAFLLKTSVLRHLTGSLCNALTGQSDGAAMLARLWQENVFLTRLGEQEWYRYHDLFAEMLNNQLQTQFPQEIPDLHRRAAEWYRTHNAPADAVYHLLAIEDWEEAASLIERMALRELEEFGEDARLLRWLQQLPETVVQQHKTLLFVYLRLARVGTPRVEVENFLARIETNITRKSMAEQTSDERQVVEEIQRLRRQWAIGGPETPQLPTGGEHDDVWQMLSGIVRFQSYYRRPELDKAEALAREVYEAARAGRNLFIILIAGGAYATVAAARGHLRQSEKIAHQVLQHALAQRGKLPEPASITLNTLSRVYLERNQLAQAHQMLLRVAEVDPNPTSSNMLIARAIQRALIQSAQGNNDAAQTTIQAARELHAQHPSGLWLDEDLIAYQVLFCVRNGDAAGAERLLNERGDIDAYPFTLFVRAEILLAQKRYAPAQDLLARLLAQYPHGLRNHPLLGARVMFAIALFEQHQLNQARQVMAEAVRLAGPESFVRPFLDYGSQCAPVLALVLRTEKLTAEIQSFVKETLRILGYVPGTRDFLPADELAALSTAASISAREQEVLRMVSTGASNQEIAAKLSISDNTVNTHLKNIYRKLDVNSRMQAVTRAQALQLV